MKTKDLCCTFFTGPEPVYAIKQVNLTITRKKFTVLRGPSGSGKTTCINALGALEKPSSGEIYFNNNRITGLSEFQCDELRRLKMGFVFQSIGLISIMSAYENVEFALRVAGYAPDTRKEWAEQCLHMVGMYKRRNHLPAELSGGEQQRVAIARAFAHKPDIIFADEPTSALDTMLGLQVVKLFKELVENQGMTIVMTTHDPNIMEVADYVYTLEDGRIVEEDTTMLNTDCK
ncbi:MAG: ABC transporter ATP-binding protein [Spirochaetales bacterium]|nr:ABC transporter ATP-binding protein [Spirochaetales bacterium]